MANSEPPRKPHAVLIVTCDPQVAERLSAYFERRGIAVEHVDEPDPDQLRGRLVATDLPELMPLVGSDGCVIEPCFTEECAGIGFYSSQPARGNVGRIGLLVSESGPAERALKLKLGLPHVPAGHAGHVPCLPEPTPDEVRGKHIAGWLELLPLWVACHAHAVTTVPHPHWGLEQAAREPHPYHVTQHWFSWGL